jgi:hypothetical protein
MLHPVVLHRNPHLTVVERERYDPRVGGGIGFVFMRGSCSTTPTKVGMDKTCHGEANRPDRGLTTTSTSVADSE